MADLTKELGTAKKAADKFHDAETRTHDELHTALAGAYKFYDAGKVTPVALNSLLLSAGLLPTNTSPEYNQIIKLIFYPDPKTQSEKRQVISKWAIVLRELEEAKVKPGDAKAHIEKQTIDGLGQTKSKHLPPGLNLMTDDMAVYKLTATKEIVSSDDESGVFVTVETI